MLGYRKQGVIFQLFYIYGHWYGTVIGSHTYFYLTFSSCTYGHWCHRQTVTPISAVLSLRNLRSLVSPSDCHTYFSCTFSTYIYGHWCHRQTVTPISAVLSLRNLWSLVSHLFLLYVLYVTYGHWCHTYFCYTFSTYTYGHWCHRQTVTPYLLYFYFSFFRTKSSSSSLP